MTTETKNDFTEEDLAKYVLTDELDLDNFWDEEKEKYVFPVPVYKLPDDTEYKPHYNKYLWAAEKDNRGFPVIVGFETEELDEDEAEEYAADNEFTYEGGYIPGLGFFRMVGNGNLGDGHEAWALVEHESGRLFRIGGWYSSWDSGEWNECVEVEVAEVKVVRYKPKGGDDSEAFENPSVTV